MIFDALWGSARRGELLLIDGGMCHFHVRRDGQLTIREIIATRRGAGSEMLARLDALPGWAVMVAKCPADLAANAWYARKGFVLAAVERTRTGREVNVWRRPRP